jgi:AcrR family transcriptional regulator
VGGGRIAEFDAHQEPVELRLWQRKGPNLVRRILRRHDEEWVRERMRDTVHGYLALFHGLEQRALRLWRCAVDLIGEHQLGEDRTAVKLE